MKNGIRLAFRKGDWIAILLVVMLAVGTAAAFVPESEQAGAVQIFQEGKLVKELPLEVNAEMQIGGDYSNTVTILDGRAAITESDCPGEDCVHSGWISSAGRSVVCLPNRVEVRITGASDVDFVVG